MLQGLFDNTKTESLVNKFRKKRFRFFLNLIKDLAKPVNILDIGGTEVFWRMMAYFEPRDVLVTIVNIENLHITLPNFSFLKGDGRDLSLFRDKEFDIVFSNSVIEHLESFTDQKKMADEIIRTGKSYFIQTPNYYFPVEPHYMFPLFQFLPVKLKIKLLTHFNLGRMGRCRDENEALKQIDSIRLLKKNELALLFPDARIYEERFLFLTKSYVMYKRR